MSKQCMKNMEKKYRDTLRHDSRDLKMARAESLVGSQGGRYGVDMISRETTSMAERPMYADVHDMSDATIKETSWDLSRIVERPTLIATLDWQTTTAFSLKSLAIPGSILPIKLAQIPFSSFLFWRGDVIIRIQVAGSPIVQGILAATFVPLVSEEQYASMNTDISSLTINPTVYLYANTNSVAELRIPYNHPHSYLRTEFKGDIAQEDTNLGYVLLYVLQPLLAIGNVTKVTVSIFSILENSEFKVPRVSSNIKTQLASLENNVATAESFLSSALSSIQSIGSIVSPIVDKLTTSTKSSLTRSRGKSKKEIVEDVEAKAMPENFIGDTIDLVGDALGGVLSVFGLDNPTIPTEEGRVIVKSNGSMNYTVGPEHIEKLALAPAALPIITAETFGTVQDEMDVAYLYKKYSFMGVFDIGLQDVGTLLYSIPLSPFPTLSTAFGSSQGPTPIGTYIQTNVNFPLLSYLGLPYRYWTGGLRYKVLVCASSLHTCKLFFAFNYGTLSVPVSLGDAASQYGAAVEISQGSNEFEFSVPYVAPVPYLDVCTGSMTPTNSMGTLNVYIMNRLVAPTTVAQSISCVMFIAGADDFSYEMLGAINPAVTSYKPTAARVYNTAPDRAYDLTLDESGQSVYRTIAMAESGVEDVQSTAPMNVVATITDVATEQDLTEDQIAPPQVSLTVDDHFGITSISLRALLKRYQVVDRLLMDVPNNICPYYVTILDPARYFCAGELVSPSETVPYFENGAAGVLSWAGAMYRQFKGSLRFKVVIEGYNILHLPCKPYAAYALWLPGPKPQYQPDISSVMELALMSLPTETIRYDTDTGDFATSSTSKLTVLTSTSSNVLEFEMPYSAPLNSSLIRSRKSEPSGLQVYLSGLGTIVLCVPRLTDTEETTYRATVYMAFGDESRFGSLYRVPLVYIPGKWKKVDNVPTVVANVGFGTYPIKKPTGTKIMAGRRRVAKAECAIAESGMGVTSDFTNQLVVGAPPAQSTKSLAASSGTSKQRRDRLARLHRRNYARWVKMQITGFLTKHRGCSRDEFNKFMDSIAVTPEAQANLAKVFTPAFAKSCGIRIISDKFYIDQRNWYGNNRRHRPITTSMKDNQPQSFKFDPMDWDK